MSEEERPVFDAKEDSRESPSRLWSPGFVTALQVAAAVVGLFLLAATGFTSSFPSFSSSPKVTIMGASTPPTTCLEFSNVNGGRFANQAIALLYTECPYCCRGNDG